ncbi:hypothetical protein GCM10027082_19940 [Comamonas humi]
MKLAIRNLTQVNIKGKASSAVLSSEPALIIVGDGEGRRRRNLLMLLTADGDLNARMIAVGYGAEGEAQFSKRLEVERLTCHDTRDAIRTLSRNSNDTVSIFVDVSCLSRQQMGSIFSEIKNLARSGPVDLQIGYSLARYVKPTAQWSSSIRRIAPVNDEFAGWTAAPDNPIELIVALGYEKGKAIGAAEYLEPGDTWLFVPTSPEEKYLEEVREQNKDLLQELNDKQMEYGVMEPVDAYHSLLSLVRGTRRTARPILLPFGPKVFFALSLLVAMIIEEAAVWFVDGENTSSTDQGQPSPHAVILSCRIEPVVETSDAI